ncbi:MAG TPA: hypothetical protein DCY15_01635 [Ruminococcaceae bacterium]|nr:hypothetical protein [Oscillospiraceae bacterium]
MIKLLIGGSPCTFWSIAQKNNRETEAEGIGWELFKNYLVAKEKFKPDFFLYENNKSAAQAIKDSIKKELKVYDETMFMQDSGVRYIEINSALVSAQNRQRFYVHNCGEVEQPEDRGILLRDILESGVTDREKARAVIGSAGRTTEREYFMKHQGNMCAEPIRIPPYGNDDKSRPVIAGYAYKGAGAGSLQSECFPDNPNKQQVDYIAEPVRVGALPRPNGELSTSAGMRIYSADGKGCCLMANGGGQGAKTGLYAVPTMKVKEATTKGYTEIEAGNCVDLTQPKSKTRRGRNMKDKCNCLTKQNNYYQYCGTIDKPIYEVKGGMITIKGKQYPIKLVDGFYIIRKLTVTECARLQTMPDDYCRAVSDSQAYKGFGNGWTAEVIIHILNGALKDIPRDEEIVVLSMYDGIGTGRYCLDKMGFTNVKYYAYEIDKYAKQIAMSNYPDIIQMGDAFQLRHPDWTIGY